MRCFWDERQRAHAPAEEFFNGRLHPAAEHQGRVDAILAAVTERTRVVRPTGVRPRAFARAPGSDARARREEPRETGWRVVDTGTASPEGAS